MNPPKRKTPGSSSRKKRRPKKNPLGRVVGIRLTEEKFQEYKTLLNGCSHNDMSRLLRDILHNKTIKVFTRDQTLDNTMEELSRLRSEIRAIGVNINQITRFFNTYPEPQRKALYAKMAFAAYASLEPKLTELLQIVSQLAKRWLSE